jgi:hypothetical protein
MDKNIIKQHLTQRFVNEAKGETATPGITVTNSVNKKSGDVNKKGVKDMEKDLSAYDKALKKGAETTKVPNKFNYNGDSEIEYHNQMEILNGTEMNEYDREPTKEFKDRAKEGLTGSERMGNKGGKDVGNAEETWGASSDDFGKEKDKNIKASTKKRQDAVKGIISFGDDIETVSKDYAPMSKHTAYNENKDNNKPKIKESMKRLNFKKEFKGVGNALKMIPESYKVDNKVFEMTDGNESYKIRWEGTLTEGKAVVLVASDKTMVNEDMQKMKHLMGYKSQDTLGLVRGKSRINENAVFSDMYKKTKALLEGEDIDDSSAAEGDMDAAVKHAAEAKKHVEGSVSTEKGTQAPAPKTGNLEDVKKKAPEATKHVEGSVSTEKGTQAPTPKTGNWDVNVKGQAPEAKKHVTMKEGIQLGENFFAPMSENSDELMDLEFQRRKKEKEDALNAASSSNTDTRDIYDLKQTDTRDIYDLKQGVKEYGSEHEMPLDTAVNSMSLNKEGMMNEGFGISSLIDKAREIANKLLPTLSDEEKQNIMAVGNQISSKLGDPKSIISKLGGVEQLSPEEDKELTQQAQQVSEGIFGDAMKRWSARFAALIGAPAGLAASIIGMAASGYNTWGDSQFLSKMHDAIEGTVGQAGGPLSVLLFFLSFIMLFAGLVNWNAGKK